MFVHVALKVFGKNGVLCNSPVKLYMKVFGKTCTKFAGCRNIVCICDLNIWMMYALFINIYLQMHKIKSEPK